MNQQLVYETANRTDSDTDPNPNSTPATPATTTDQLNPIASTRLALMN
jgi:hypothetical protein